MQKWIIIIIIGVITMLGAFIVLNVDVETEYIPESEVEESQLRNTIVTLYYIDKETGDLAKENRLIDSKDLLKNPYKSLLEMLCLDPESVKNEKIIAEKTDIIDVKLEKGVAIINFNKKFLEGIESEKIQSRKKAIYQTLTSLTEVSDVKILVEGTEIEL